MKAAYFYDPQTKMFTSVNLIANDEDMPANATDIQPIAEDGTGLYDPKWNGQEWVGLTADEYDEAHKNDPVDNDEGSTGPTSDQQAMTALIMQVSDTQDHIKSLEQAITAIISGGN